MGTLWLSEHYGQALNSVGLIPLPPKAQQILATGSTASTATVGAGTNMITVQADVVSWLLVGSSGSTGVATSTNAYRIPANALPMPFAVAPNSKIGVITT